MKIIILTVDHLYSNKIIKELIKNYKNEIVLIAQSGVLLYKKNLFQSLLRYLEISGLIYVMAQFYKLLIYKIIINIYPIIFPNKIDGKFYPVKTLAKKYNIPLIKINNINNQDACDLIKKLDADLIISVYFNQILKKDIILIPKKRVINIHPAYLPDYKGISPVFWALANKEKFAGTTIHSLDIGIDTGEIYARKKIEIKKEDTEDSLYWRCTIEAIPLLIKVIENIRLGKVESIKNNGGRYFSLPTKSAVATYLKRSKTFFRLKEYLFCERNTPIVSPD